MFWIIIVVVSLLMIFAKFSSDWKNQNTKLTKEGGVATKYHELIKILQSDSNPKIFQSDIDTYLFGWVTPNADNRFRIMQTFQFVNIKWQFKGKIVFENKVINLSKEWKFPENENQEQMANKVLKEMREIFERSEFGGY